MNKWILLFGLMIVSGNIYAVELKQCDYENKCEEEINNNRDAVYKVMELKKKVRLMKDEIKKIEKEIEIESNKMMESFDKVYICKEKIKGCENNKM